MDKPDPNEVEDIPEVTYDPARAKRGALNPLPATKERITIRLDRDILAWFKQEAHDRAAAITRV